GRSTRGSWTRSGGWEVRGTAARGTGSRWSGPGEGDGGRARYCVPGGFAARNSVPYELPSCEVRMAAITLPTGIGLTTNQAPFIEQARRQGDVFIRQPYELYSAENQDTWRRLYARIRPRWEKYANAKFLQGVRN